MRTFGTIRLTTNPEKKEIWEVECEPHVMIRLKAVFPKIRKFELGKVHLAHTPENCRDLEWFLQRYDLKLENTADLAANATVYRKNLERMEEIISPSHTPMTFALNVLTSEALSIAGGGIMPGQRIAIER